MNSKYWNKMQILRNGKKFFNKPNSHNSSIFISEEIAIFPSNEKYVIKHNEKENISSISDFYRKYFRILKTNDTIILSEKDIEKFLNVDSELITLYDENNTLIGSIISVPFGVRSNLLNKAQGGSSVFGSANYLNNSERVIDNERVEKLKGKDTDIVIACASYLILHKNYRSQGLGMLLIQESLKVLHENEGKAAYFINRVSRCDNALVLNAWYYPINIEKLNSCKYPYPDLYKFETKSNNKIVNCLQEVELSYSYYMKHIEDKKMAFSPSFEMFKKWITSFPSFIVLNLSKEEIIGFFSLNILSIYHPLHQTELIKAFVILNLNNIIKDVIDVCRELKLCDILIFYEVGNVTNKLLKETFCQPLNSSYINFYNLNLFLKKEEFFCPLF